MKQNRLTTIRRGLLAATAFTFAGLLATAVMADPVPIRIVSKDLSNTNSQDVAHIERIEKALAERGTEVDIEIVEVASTGYPEVLTAMLLSGNIPDIIYFQGGDAKMAEQGILEDLTPYIENSKYLKAGMWPHNVERMKNYPYLLYVQPIINWQPVIRRSWLEKAGLGVPETLDDYVALFKAIRDSDFDGNGVKDTYAMTSADNTTDLDAIFNPAFGINATWIPNEAGEFIHSRVSTQERDKLAFYAMLGAEGLYDPEYVSTKWDVKEDKFYTGRAGIIFSFQAGVYDIYQAKLRELEPDAELVLLPPPVGPGGQGLAALDVSKESRGFAISVTSEHKDVAFEVLDFMAGPEGQFMDQMGFEGEEYTLSGDTYTLTEKSDDWYTRFWSTANWVSPVARGSQAGLDSIAQLQKYFKADNAFVWPPEYSADLDATENVYRSWVYKFISGQAGMDQWDAYVAEWNAAGGARLTEYARSVLTN